MRRIAMLALGTVLLGCGEPAPTPPPPQSPLAFRDVLGEWQTRFAAAPEGATDAVLPPLGADRQRELLDLLAAATTRARGMARVAAQAQEDLRAAGAEAVAALEVFLAQPECVPEDGAQALAVFGDEPPPALATLAIRLLEPGPEWRRVAAAQLLATFGSRHPVPRLLRRLKYWLDQPAALNLEICRTLAELGNPSGIPNLIGCLADENLREGAGAVLVRILELFGQAYEESDGWSGLERKARAVHASWRATGRVTFGEEAAKTFAHEDAYRTERERWLFFRELGGEPLRPSDEARFVARSSGTEAVPLVREALHDGNRYVRIYALEMLRGLGHVAAAAAGDVQELLRDPFCRSNALETLGALGGDQATKMLGAILAAAGGSTGEERVAALKGLMHLADPRTIDLLRRVRDESGSPDERVWAAAALITSARATEQGARAFLERLLSEGSYHAPTLREILDR